jgi:hypothetical protein
MTTIPTFSFPDANTTLPDDQMDLASSPYPRHEDVDIDLESAREPSVAGSVLDEMIEDALPPHHQDQDGMQDVFDDDLLLPDDEMIDESKASVVDDKDIDFNMDNVDEQDLASDEDILYDYDENEQTETVADQHAIDDQAEVPPSAETAHKTEPEVATGVKELDYLPEEADLAEDTNNNKQTTEPEDLHPTGHISSANATNEADAALSESLEQAEPQTEETDYLDTLEATINENQHGASLAEEFHAAETSEAQEDSSEQDVTTVAENARGEDNSATQHVGDAEADHLLEGPEETAAHDRHLDVQPVTLRYGGDEMSLFHDHQPMYLLENSALAFETLDKLLAACRNVLDSSLAHGHELVLDIPGLGLHICEDSVYAPRITLHEILDTYHHLCQNDEGSARQPLYCILSTRVSLSAQVAYLNQSRINGSKYADIAAKYHDAMGAQDDEKNVNTAYEEAGENQDEYTEEVYLEHQEDEVDERNGVDQLYDEVSAEAAYTPGVLQQPDSTDISSGAAPGTIQLQTESSLEPDHRSTDTDQHDQIDLFDGLDDEIDELSQAEVNESHASHEAAAARTALDAEEQEYETNSSHTMEGDQPGETAEAEVAGGDDLRNGIDDLIGNYDQLSPDLEVDENEPANPSNAVDQHVHKETDDPDNWNTADAVNQPFDDDILDLDDDEFPTTTDASTGMKNGDSVPLAASPSHTSAPGNPSPPLTPPSGKSSKRKIEDDEDELLFLDLDTPDTKRVRST